MYYKIEKKECEVYKKLHELRTKELQMEKENLQLINERVGVDFESFKGQNSQASLSRVKMYSGFKFVNQKQVSLNVWKKDADNEEYFVPNRRTKAELSKEAINLLDLLVSPVDANFELGTVLLPNYKKEFDEYLFGKDFDYKLTMKDLLQTYHFYKFWFSEVEFDKFDLEDLNFLVLAFIRWENGKIGTSSFCSEISKYFDYSINPQTSKLKLTSFYSVFFNKKICKEIEDAYSDEALEYFNRDLQNVK